MARGMWLLRSALLGVLNKTRSRAVDKRSCRCSEAAPSIARGQICLLQDRSPPSARRTVKSCRWINYLLGEGNLGLKNKNNDHHTMKHLLILSEILIMLSSVSGRIFPSEIKIEKKKSHASKASELILGG